MIFHSRYAAARAVVMDVTEGAALPSDIPPSITQNNTCGKRVP